MGTGTDGARALGSDIHADVLDDFKDQLLIVLLNRLAVNGRVSVPVAEVDATGRFIVSFSVVDGEFRFELEEKWH